MVALEDKIFEEFKKIVIQQLSVQPDEVDLDSQFIEDLGADSLDMVELVLAIEEGFQIEVPDEKVNEINTVEEAVKLIRNAVEENNM
uniref:acyl carrier protein n=1 Tax=Hypnea wynnei TaxID=1867777 RepID=UPI0027DA9B58|nr:acyl carrier protein [Hypnea wynnei]WCH56549.1 acyl carrier protein [Hypnea wynnei]